MPCITGPVKLFNIFMKAWKQYNICAGTVINTHWILTAATCCKQDDIVTIKFNDYSGLVQLMNVLSKGSTFLFQGSRSGALSCFSKAV